MSAVTNDMVDDAILEAIRCGQNQFALIRDSVQLAAIGPLDMRVVDRRLQVLRRKKLVTFDHPGCDVSNPKRWRLLPENQR